MNFNEEKLAEIICNVGKLDMTVTEIKKEMESKDIDLMKDLSFDSLLMVELVVEIEDAFDIEFDMNDLNINKIKNYSNLKLFIESMCNE